MTILYENKILIVKIFVCIVYSLEVFGPKFRRDILLGWLKDFQENKLKNTNRTITSEN